MTDPRPERNEGVNDAFAERVPALAADVRAAESFASLYERTFPKVYAYVASLLRDRSAAEDVMAQAFERAYRKRRSYRPAQGEPRRRGCSGSPATPRSTSCAGASAAPPSRPTPRTRPPPSLEEHADFTLRREVVRAALAELSGQERDLVSLKFSGGLSNAEIAGVLGLSESNAGTRLHRTITKLRKACHEVSLTPSSRTT